MIFKIETNKNFMKIKLQNKKENFIKKKIYNNFILSHKIKSIYSIKKKSTTSNIYEILEINGKKKILRSSNVSNIYKIQWIIKKINLLNNNYFFNLIKTTNNKFFYTYKKNIFLLYNRIPGVMYSGEISEFYKILKKAILLHFEFKNKNKFKKIKIKKNFKNFQNLIAQKNFFINSIIRKQTHNLLQRNKKFILSQMKKIQITKNLDDIQVVHADINHSNIIINNSGITFLDIEDIKQDSLSVALSFLIFKLTRHSIYKKKITLKKFRNVVIDKILKILRKNNIKLNKIKIMKYSFFKLLSDVELIISQMKNRNFQNYYDLEKKLHNLIEIRYMFSNERKF